MAHHNLTVARRAAEAGSAAEALRAAASGGRLALVPTMGALHEGHLALVAEARRRADAVAVSIFVNPAQFGPGEDLSRYPRDEEGDLSKLARAGCDLAYLPTPAEMYPAGEETRVVPGALAEPLDGASRPGHFAGVCTVVAKLFGQLRPDVAVFGEKDYQQLAVIRRMTADLALRVEIVGVPTVREADGLALSSRNRYLSPPERRIAARLPETLFKVASRLRGGVPTDTAVAQGLAALQEAGFVPDYLEVRRAADLSPYPPRGLRREEAAEARLFAAARLGATRLIDNLPVAQG
jgi:pantoate--beta-alanine ligase